jgi:hypothetical protein
LVGTGAGISITTGGKNTVIGGYDGNQGGLDIRTASNYIVLSDGDGNPLVSTADNQTVALEGAVPNSGTGITFPATQSASSNANTLDDYEEGTWTPTYYGSTSTGTTTYTTQSGIYTKVGRVVTATFNLLVTNATGTGDIRIGGLPFASDSSAANQTMSAIAADSLTWTGDYLVLYVQNGTSIGRIYRVTAGSGLNDTAIDTACSLYATVTYIASA